MLNEIGEFKWIQHFVQYRKFRMLDEMLDPFKFVLSSFLQNLVDCFLHKYGFRSDYREKFLTNTSTGRKSSCPETRYTIRNSYLHK